MLNRELEKEYRGLRLGEDKKTEKLVREGDCAGDERAAQES